MVTVHRADTERRLRRYAQIAGGEPELQRGFESWYAEHAHVPTADEFTEHLIQRRHQSDTEMVRARFAALKRAAGARR